MDRQLFPPIPKETARAAHAIFGKNNLYLTIGDHTAFLFANLLPMTVPDDFRNSPLTMPMYYLLTVFQYIETLPDRRAVDAVRERIDWKYSLHLPINFLQVEPSSLCTFRRWLRAEVAGLKDFQTLLWRLSEISCLPGREGDTTDAALIVNQVCSLNRISEIWEAMSRVLGALGIRQPEWLRSISQPHWYLRYNHGQSHWEERFEKPDWEKFVLSIGCDGSYLLEEVSRATDRDLVNLPK